MTREERTHIKKQAAAKINIVAGDCCCLQGQPNRYGIRLATAKDYRTFYEQEEALQWIGQQ